MNCVGGSNDGKTFPARAGLRHGSLVEVPIFKTTIDGYGPDETVPVAVPRENYIERYRCFKFWLNNSRETMTCLVTDAWTDDQAFDEIRSRASRGEL